MVTCPLEIVKPLHVKATAGVVLPAVGGVGQDDAVLAAVVVGHGRDQLGNDGDVAADVGQGGQALLLAPIDLPPCPPWSRSCRPGVTVSVWLSGGWAGSRCWTNRPAGTRGRQRLLDGGHRLLLGRGRS